MEDMGQAAGSACFHGERKEEQGCQKSVRAGKRSIPARRQRALSGGKRASLPASTYRLRGTT